MEAKQPSSRSEQRKSMLSPYNKRGAGGGAKSAPREQLNPLNAGGGVELTDLDGAPSSPPPPEQRMSRGQMHINKLRIGTKAMMNAGAAVDEIKRESNAISLRECLRVLFKLRRDRFIKECLRYIAYVLLFSVIIFQINNYSWMWAQNDSLVTELEIEEEFYELRSMDDTFDYMQGTFLDALYPVEWYNEDAFTADELGYVRHAHRLVGGVQLRQLRVLPDSCEERRHLNLNSRFDTKSGTCYSEFEDTDGVSDKTPFGPAEDPERYTYSEGHSLLDGLYGFGVVYGYGGYTTDLGVNRTVAAAKLQQMRDDLWVDQATRVVAIDFNLFNTVTRLASICRMVVEFPPAGNVQVNKEFESFRLILYTANLDVTRGVLEVMWFLMLCYYIRNFCVGLHDNVKLQRGRRWLLSGETLFELLTIVLAITACIFWARFLFNSNRIHFDVNSASFDDMYTMASYYRQAMNVCSVALLTFVFKVFKFFTLSSRLNLLWMTLQAASVDMLSMVFVAIVVIYAFATSCTMIFGPHVEDFHGIVSSGSTLMRYILGDFDYLSISRANPYLAPVLFAAYTAFVLVVLINVFIAVLSRYFETVQLDQIEQSKLMDITFEYDFYSRATRKLSLQYKAIVSGTATAWWALPFRLCCSSSERMRSSSIFGHTLEDVELLKEGEMEDLFERLEYDVRWNKRLNLYNYVWREHFHANGAPLYLSLKEMCNLASPQHSQCDHRECVAKQLLDCYQSFKKVTTLQPMRTHFNARAPENEDFVFPVTKVNMFGHKQLRLMFVDVAASALVNMDPSSLNVKKTVPFNQILQIERSVHNPLRAKLIFLEGQGTFKLTFENANDREMFCKKLEQAVLEAMAAEAAAKVAGSGPPSPASPPRAGATAGPGPGLDLAPLEREMRSLAQAERGQREQVAALSQQQAAVQAHVGSVDAKLGSVEARVGAVADARLPALEEQVAAVAASQRRLEAMLKTLIDASRRSSSSSSPAPAAAAAAMLPPPPSVSPRSSRRVGAPGPGLGAPPPPPPPG